MIIIIGSVFGFLSVLMGAYGDHALKASTCPHDFDSFMTALRYHQLYSVLIIALGLTQNRQLSPLARRLGLISSLGFTVGILLFCLSIYLSIIFGHKELIKITPIGGNILMLSWIILGIFGFQNRGKNDVTS